VEAEGIEIIEGVFALPRMSLARAEHGKPGIALGIDRIVTLVREARADLERGAGSGDAIAAAVLRLAPAWRDGDLAGLGADVAAHFEAQTDAPTTAPAGIDDGGGETDRIARLFYDTAATAFGNGRLAQAVALLATLLHVGAGEADALIGLAASGARMGKFDEALALALECAALPVKHPRAYSIAGFCELERGNRKAAQAHLAMAARMARRRPELREDLRAAQRLLLVLHFA
jgi:hypothetical protein